MERTGNIETKLLVKTKKYYKPKLLYKDFASKGLILERLNRLVLVSTAIVMILLYVCMV